MLKDLRKRLGWSVNDLSSFIDVNERTVRRWEYGEIPTPKAVLLLLDIIIRIPENYDPFKKS